LINPLFAGPHCWSYCLQASTCCAKPLVSLAVQPSRQRRLR
jgi:hypothetical protein